MPKISLEQWQVFHAIVEEGSFAKAALRLHKSQSSISYAMANLQERIGFDLFVLKGRKAILTDTGKRLLHDSRQLIQSANQLEKIAAHFNADLESALTLAIDEIFPSELLYKVLAIFGEENTYTRIHLQHGILSGPSNLLQTAKADIAIVSKVPEGFLGHKLLNSESRPYANIESALHQKEVSLDDLMSERYIIAMDSGVKNKRNEGWLGSENYWKVSSIEMKIQCVAKGLGFSWLPVNLVNERNLPIKPIRLKQDNIRTYPLYLVHRKPENMGPATTRLMDIFIDVCCQK